jgi:hypothetical protein
VSEILTRLEAAGIARLIDAPAISQPRKPGFSKRLLSASLGQRIVKETRASIHKDFQYAGRALRAVRFTGR